MKSVLIIEDDENILTLFKHHFDDEVAIVFTTASSFADGVSLIAKKKFDIYIIDINLKGYSGFDILKLLQKEEAISNRVIVMSSESDPDSKAQAYNLGASNFITKPIDFYVLRAILRKNLRAIDESHPDKIITPYFLLDLNLFRCFLLKGKERTEVSLTRIEFNLLLSLAKNLNRVKKKEDLTFLGKDQNDPMSFKALEMHIASLRKKIGNNVIKTKRGVGYFLSS